MFVFDYQAMKLIKFKYFSNKIKYLITMRSTYKTHKYIIVYLGLKNSFIEIIAATTTVLKHTIN